MKSYNELEHLNRRISIYRRVTRKGEPGSFYARIRIADGKPYSIRSLGTKSAEVARDEALNLYHDLLTNPSKQTGLTINGLVEKYKNSSSSNLSKPRNTLTGRQKAQIIDLDHLWLGFIITSSFRKLRFLLLVEQQLFGQCLLLVHLL